jgi:hypothetical protein
MCCGNQTVSSLFFNNVFSNDSTGNRHEQNEYAKENRDMNLGICIAPTQPFWAALGSESRVCYNSRQANSMSAHVLLSPAVNSKSERKVNSLPPLGFELYVIFGMLAHLSGLCQMVTE